jgi:hypothetical protein
MLQLFFAQLLVFVLVFVLMDVRKVEARWLLPLMLPFLVLLPKYFKATTILKWNNIGYITFLAVILIQVMRTPIEKTFDIDSSVHYGFEQISDKLQNDYNDKLWVLPDVTYAGNIRILNQKSAIFAADDYSVSRSATEVSKSVFVVKDKEQIASKYQLKDSIIDFGKEAEDLYFYLLK